MNEKDALPMLSALSQETRLNMVRFLIGKGAEGAPAGEIADHVGAISSRASFHLSALENAGVVSSERQSRQIIYRADLQRMGALVAFILNDCCGGHPDVLACCNLDGAGC